MSAEDPDTIFTGPILASAFNKLKSLMIGDWVPRETVRYWADLAAGRLGTPQHPFLSAHVSIGECSPGEIIEVYDYAGLIIPKQGWMLCNGDLVEEEAYDAQPGRQHGDWIKYVGSSPIEGKYLPNMPDKYLIGGTPTQDGSAPLTFTGAVGHQVDLRHTHRVQTDRLNADGYNPWTFVGADQYPPGFHSHGQESVVVMAQDLPLLDVRPRSIEVKHYMRII